MSDDDYISTSIKHILANGINLYLETVEEEQHYVLKLFEYFEDKTEFTPYLRNESSVEVEGPDSQLIVEIMISQSTLYFIPYVTDVFDVFTEVLKFISRNHENIMRDFRGTEEVKIETLSEIQGLANEKEVDEDEASSEDDFEWI